ncbi:MAG: starch-binding protein, partial [Muribaculaceae bacterium]|nr:starch-binding protein [Muribaculaceae bacterium]
PQHICSTDEVAYQSGQAKPTGAPDTGEDFGSCRDLDHTSAEVQRNCKAYCQFLIQDMGYVGFRYDMTKGYSGYYNKIYNEASKPTYSVGEYFDGNYDKVRDWIEATGRQSAAFDFPCKYAMNEAFASNDMTKLSWKANGTTDQPAGMIHYGYAQYAVTFVDNHDTYRDGSKFNGNVVAANAFILCSPGTPCVFWPHYTAHKAEIQKLIEIRNAVGVHNQSGVKVLKLQRDCYMAEVYGSKGTLVVKIGGSMDSPAGYSNSDIKATGNGYCVWTKASVGGGGTDNPTVPTGESFKVYYDNSNTSWATPYIYYWGGTAPEWPGVAMTKENGNVWSYTVPGGTTGVLFNAGDGDATKTADFVAQANHIYTNAGDNGVYNNGGGQGGNDTPSTEAFNIYFDNSVSNWSTPYIYYWPESSPAWPGVAMTKVSGNVWSYKVPAGTTGVIFNAGDGDATKTEDLVAVPNHIYTTAGDQGVYSGSTTVDPITPGSYPANLYLVGNMPGNSWASAHGVAQNTKADGVYTWDNVVFEDAGEGYSYFTFLTALDSFDGEWDGANQSDRYGAAEKDAPVSVGQNSTIVCYPVNVSAMGAQSWMIVPGAYRIVANLKEMQLSVSSASGVTVVDSVMEVSPRYFNMHGVEVTNPSAGIYIVVRGDKVTKEVVK